MCFLRVIKKWGVSVKNKKLIISLFVLIFVVAFLGGYFIHPLLNVAKANKTSSANETNSSNNNVSDESNENKYENVHNGELLTQFENEHKRLDTEYQEQLDNAVSNAEILGIKNDFAELWSEKVDEYYSLMIEYYERPDNRPQQHIDYMPYSKVKEDILKMQQQWLESYEAEKEYYMDFLTTIYGGGSIIGIVAADHDYMLARSKALLLYEQYLKICRL